MTHKTSSKIILLCAFAPIIGYYAVIYYSMANAFFSINSVVHGNTTRFLANADERKYQELFIILYNKKIDTIILGSSRVMQLGADNLPPSYGNVVNNGVSGASLEDFTIIYGLYKSLGKSPKYCILGIDPWIFNTNSGQDRWQSFGRYFSELSSGKDIEPKKDLYSSIKQYAISTLVNSCKITHLRNPDNTISYGAKRTIQEAQKAIADAVVLPKYSIERFDKISNVEFLEQVVMEMKKNGVQVIFLFTPMPPSIFDCIRNNKKYKNVFSSYKIVSSLAHKNGIPVVWNYNPHATQTEDKDFIDSLHVRREYWRKVSFDFQRALESYSVN